MRCAIVIPSVFAITNDADEERDEPEREQEVLEEAEEAVRVLRGLLRLLRARAHLRGRRQAAA